MTEAEARAARRAANLTRREVALIAGKRLARVELFELDQRVLLAADRVALASVYQGLEVEP